MSAQCLKAVNVMQKIDRRKFIGGSDVAAILGLSPWKTPLELYEEKIMPRSPLPDKNKERIFARGKIMEPYVLRLFKRENGLKIAARNRRYIDDEYDFLRAEIDAETVDGENIEIKTCNPFKAKLWGEEHTDEIPLFYTAQAMHGLMITKRDVCHFGVLIGSDDFRTYIVKRDNELIDMIRSKEVEFWRRIQNRNPPPATSMDDIARLYKTNSGKTIEASTDVLCACNDLLEIKKRLSVLTKKKEELEEKIKLFMADATELKSGRTTLATWRPQNKQTLDQLLFKESHPDIYEKFTKTVESRVFRLK